ncbi:hypothetical protein HDA32_004215 [Spinactinospora alkalitolerans]|uniref:Sulfotransferase domain-containing protein n=1 Tax=Spinactinospora alkalitolerans TaxID=687207 RepID=A0A852U0M7_9ACTN|nr:sulfotransferase domain-containing protein [Spinactinospora alkalitolerans]NYE49095.1 hypothetical protein [Spinactinospora alkalitolerans]
MRSRLEQGDNIDRERVRRLTGRPEPDGPGAPRPPVREWLLGWIDGEASRFEQMDSLPGLMWHLADAWARRDRHNVVLVHYDDLKNDLEGEMRRLALLLDAEAPEDAWPVPVEAATFTGMRSRAHELTSDTSGILKDSAAFLRRGTSGSGRELLTGDELAHYRDRAARTAPPDLLDRLHR